MIRFAIIALHLAAAILPHGDVARESVVVIEKNNYFDDSGRLIFAQQIFWELRDGEESVRAWRLIKAPQQAVERDWENGGWRVAWKDGDTFRVVHSLAYRETFTQRDVEVEARELLPPSQRRELRVKR